MSILANAPPPPTTSMRPAADAQPAMPGARPDLPMQEDTGFSTDGGIQPTDEEQAIYDQVVTQGVARMDQDPKRVLDAIRAVPGDPAKAGGTYVATMMIGMEEQSGGKIPDDIVVPAAAEIGEQLAERLKDAGMPVDNAFLQRAAVTMMQQLADYYGVDESDLMQFIQSVPPNQIPSYVKEEQAFFDAAPQPQMGGMA